MKILTLLGVNNQIKKIFVITFFTPLIFFSQIGGLNNRPNSSSQNVNPTKKEEKKEEKKTKKSIHFKS